MSLSLSLSPSRLSLSVTLSSPARDPPARVMPDSPVATSPSSSSSGARVPSHTQPAAAAPETNLPRLFPFCVSPLVRDMSSLAKALDSLVPPDEPVRGPTALVRPSPFALICITPRPGHAAPVRLHAGRPV
ncbi:hypothetical protein CDD83_9720 [Cordyceps sp. RAO-2017]|nr:hypothetical protein CDD83_9720 [Cordyceps sp. RAO-2017]